MINQQIFLKEKPTNELSQRHFEMKSSEIIELPSDCVLIEVTYISIDAANRAWMQGPTYREQILPGDLMGGYALGKIIKSNSSSFKVGEHVEGDLGWQKYAIKKFNQVTKAIIKDTESLHMSVFGLTGRTAYFGLEIANIKPFQTILVSAAAGAVGNMVGQIAKLKGCKVVGVTGSEEKSHWLINELGFDGAVTYKNKNYRKQLREICPEKIDVYFDNVGGKIFETALFSMKNFGKIICCGALSQYDTSNFSNSPRGVPGLIVTKRLSVKGFIVLDFDDRKKEAEDNIHQWIKEKKIKPVYDIIEGIENTPQALIGLLNGDNKGKRLVKL